MQLYFLTQIVFFGNLRPGNEPFTGYKMQTLTHYFEHLYTEGVLDMTFQKLENKTFTSYEYNDLTISGARYSDLVFEEIIFINCNLFGTTLENCLFINCLFINCKFQFSHFNNCNFELTSWEDCKWGFTDLSGSEMLQSVGINTLAFESKGLDLPTTTLTLSEFLNLSA